MFSLRLIRAISSNPNIYFSTEMHMERPVVVFMPTFRHGGKNGHLRFAWSLDMDSDVVMALQCQVLFVSGMCRNLQELRRLINRILFAESKGGRW
jgi:hypothetical protein